MIAEPKPITIDREKVKAWRTLCLDIDRLRREVDQHEAAYRMTVIDAYHPEAAREHYESWTVTLHALAGSYVELFALAPNIHELRAALAEAKDLEAAP